MTPLRQRSAYTIDADKRQMPNSLEQENFNLKLRIYHLEERLAQQYPGDISELVRFNAELNAQLDMKNEAVQQRDLLLVKARNVIESLQNDIELLKASNGIKSDTDRNMNQEEMRRSNLTINQLSSKLQESERKLKFAEDELASVNLRLDDATHQLAQRSSECERARDTVAHHGQISGENDHLKGCIEKLKQQLKESQENCSSLKDNLSSSLLRLHGNDDVKARVESELLNARAELKRITDLHASVSDRLRAAEVAEREKHSALIELEKKLSESSVTTNRLENDLSAFSKREAALLNELHKWKSLSQSQHEDKQNLEQLHHQSVDKVQKSVQAYSDTLKKLSTAINSIVHCLHLLHVPSIPLYTTYNENEPNNTAYNDDERPPKFDVNDPEHADLTASWIERKVQRIARIRSCFKVAISQIEENCTKQFSQLENMLRLQDKTFQDISKQLKRIRQPDTSRKGLSFVEERLHAIARELDASSSQLRS